MSRKCAAAADFRDAGVANITGRGLGGVGGIAVALCRLGAWAVIAQALIMELVSIIVLMRADPRRIAFHLTVRSCANC